MRFKVYRFELGHRHLPTKRGLLLEDKEGHWSEVSPLEGRSKESLEEALQQLQALNRGWPGWRGPLLPSVAFGLYGLTAPPVPSIPCALFLCGTPQEVLTTAERSHGCTMAKLKIGHWTLQETIEVLQTLSLRLRLRLDFNYAWDPAHVHELCSHLSPHHIEFLEDPGCTVNSFPIAQDSKPCPSSLTIWKPMIRGLPSPYQPVILSSSLESSIGLRNIASLIHSHQIPPHALGIGTAEQIEDDLVFNRAILKDGMLHFPSSWNINYNKLLPC